MIQYWPNAERITAFGDTERISTYDGADTLQIAAKQFGIWRDHYKYKLTRCWIDVYWNGIKTGTINEEDLP